MIFPSNRVRIMVATKPVDFRNDERPWPRWGRVIPKRADNDSFWDSKKRPGFDGTWLTEEVCHGWGSVAR